MAQSPLNITAQPVDSKEEGRSPTMDKQCLKRNTVVVRIALADLKKDFWDYLNSSDLHINQIMRMGNIALVGE